MRDERNLRDVRAVRWERLDLDARGLGARMVAFVRRLAVHDVIELIYLSLVPLALWVAPASAARDRMLSHHVLLLLLVGGAVVAARSEAGQRSLMVGIIYRTALVSSLVVTYLLLGETLPILNQGTLDHQLYHLDLAIFGMEPAMLMERWATPLVTDWFALWYLSYFLLLGFFVLPIVFFTKNLRLLGELAVAIIMIYSVGQTLYTVVPGFGPLYAMPESFAGPLRGGPFFDLMNAIVVNAGAQKDIFPSLHTAVPMMMTILAVRHRRGELMRYVWPLVAFATANIIIATMFLRWHYLIDVVAGALLAVIACAIAVRVTDWELERRKNPSLGPLWPRWP